MKKLSMILSFLFISTLIAVPAFPLSYEIDVGQDGTFETGGAISLNVSESVTMDIYVDGYSCAPSDRLFGTQKYILLDESQVTVSGFPYDTGNGGPWDPSFCQFAQQEPNVYILATGNFSFVTVIGNRQKLGTMTLTCAAAGTSTVRIANDLTSFGYPDYSDGFIADCDLASQFPTDALLTVNPQQAACGNGAVEAGEQCDDGNTVGGDCCSATCTLEAAGSPCPDGIYCNGAETCDAEGSCLAGTTVVCNDGIACTVDSCNEATDSCDYVPNNSACSDGQYCNGNEICNPASGCVAGTPVECPDDGSYCNGTESCNEATDSCTSSGNPCPDGTVCNEETDICEEVGCSIDEECDDGLYCNGAETCDTASGNCQAGTPVDCNDEVDCTTDSCNEAMDRCDNTPSNAACNDGLYCNGNEVCDPVDGCQPGTPVECPDDGSYCNGEEICNEATDSCTSSGNPCAPGTVCNEETDTCEEAPGCTIDEECDNGLFCDGSETCNTDTGNCQAGIPANCDDGVACTIDSCNESTDSCDNIPDNAVCDDGNFCNGNEVCDPVDGCQPGTPVECPDDGAFCNGIESCNEATDSCTSSGNPCPQGTTCNDETDTCDEVPVEGCLSDADCDDGIFCNGKEKCSISHKKFLGGTYPPVFGICKPGKPVDCNDGVDCTVDSCNEAMDRCDNAPDNAVCDDGNFCNGNEVCDPADGCQPGKPVECTDDGLFCNGTESCNEAKDSCTSSGNPCNPGTTVCNEKTDTCDPLQEGCTSDAECDDGIFCNGKETCNVYARATGEQPVVGVCQDGIPVDCNDGVDCTLDSCNEAKDICEHVPDNAVCDDGNFCNGNEVCDPADGCQPGKPVECPDDGLFCNGTESCNEAKDSCTSSGNPCNPGTTVCNEKTGTCDPLQEGCTSDADCDDGIFCNGKETCNVYSKATGKPPVYGVCLEGIPVDCNDGVDCTVDSCNENTESCENISSDEYCPDDGKFCNGTEFCDVDKGCSSTGNPCPEGTVCNEKKDSCDPQESITVKMDIKPGSCPNPINLRSRGVLPVAILGSKDFNVKDIDPATIMLGREGIPGGVAPIRYNYADVATPFMGELCDCNSLYGDGNKDLTLKFKKAEVINELLLEEVAGQIIPLTITFSLKEDKGGTAYSAEDCLKILKKREKQIKFWRDRM